MTARRVPTHESRDAAQAAPGDATGHGQCPHRDQHL